MRNSWSWNIPQILRRPSDGHVHVCLLSLDPPDVPDAHSRLRRRPHAPTHLCSQLHLHKGSRGHNSPVVAAPLAQEPGNRLEASQFPAVPSPTRLQPYLPARQSPRMWLRPFPDKSEAHGETDGSISLSFRNAEIHFVFVHGGISSPPQQRRRTLS